MKIGPYAGVAVLALSFIAYSAYASQETEAECPNYGCFSKECCASYCISGIRKIFEESVQTSSSIFKGLQEVVIQAGGIKSFCKLPASIQRYEICPDFAKICHYPVSWAPMDLW